MKPWERVIYIMQQEGLNKNSLSSLIGLNQNATIGKIVNNHLSPRPTTLNRIADALPKYNREWIVNGIGEILSENPNPVRTKSEEFINATRVYDVDATCGASFRDFNIVEENIIGYVYVPDIKPGTVIIRANGDSMSPVILNGDWVAVREIHNKDDIFYGQIYLVITEEYRMLKYLRRYKEDEKNKVILRSCNENYDDIVFEKNKIIRLFIVENIMSIKNLI